MSFMYIFLNSFGFAGTLLFISGLLWLARGVIGCIIARHIHRNDGNMASWSRRTKLGAPVGENAQAEPLGAAAEISGSEFGAQQQSNRELNNLLS